MPNPDPSSISFPAPAKGCLTLVLAYRGRVAVLELGAEAAVDFTDAPELRFWAVTQAMWALQVRCNAKTDRGSVSVGDYGPAEAQVGQSGSACGVDVAGVEQLRVAMADIERMGALSLLRQPRGGRSAQADAVDVVRAILCGRQIDTVKVVVPEGSQSTYHERLQLALDKLTGALGLEDVEVERYTLPPGMKGLGCDMVIMDEAALEAGHD